MRWCKQGGQGVRVRSGGAGGGGVRAPTQLQPQAPRWRQSRSLVPNTKPPELCLVLAKEGAEYALGAGVTPADLAGASAASPGADTMDQSALPHKGQVGMSVCVGVGMGRACVWADINTLCGYSAARHPCASATAQRSCAARTRFGT